MKFSFVNFYKSIFPIRITGYVGEVYKDEVIAFAKSLRPQSMVLDARAGDMPWKGVFADCNYKSADICYEENKLDVSNLDYVVDIEDMKEIPSDTFDAILCTFVLEHVKHPALVIKEFHRIMKKGGRLLLVTHPAFEDHQQPNNFFYFTQYGIRLLFDEAGLKTKRINYIGGYFVFLSQWLRNFWFYFGDSRFIKVLDLLTYPMYFLISSILLFLARFDKKKTLSVVVLGEAIKN